jgi:hypothetical protein
MKANIDKAAKKAGETPATGMPQSGKPETAARTQDTPKGGNQKSKAPQGSRKH